MFRFIQKNAIQRRGIVYQFTIFSKILFNVTISIVFKTLIANRISDHFIFPSTTKCLKQIIKQNVILGIYIPRSQVLYICYQGRIILRKTQKCPSRGQRFHLGFFPLAVWHPVKKQVIPYVTTDKIFMISLGLCHHIYWCQHSHYF